MEKIFFVFLNIPNEKKKKQNLLQSWNSQLLFFFFFVYVLMYPKYHKDRD